MANKRKWYVVWVGTQPGVCDSWEECRDRIEGYPGARYKSFSNQEDAVIAFRNGEDAGALLRAIANGPTPSINYLAYDGVVADSIAVDGACAGNPGVMEYRGVDVQTGAELFRRGPFPEATNNIGEFLALVHALALFARQGNDHTAIYTDSRTALAWLRNRKSRSTLARTPRNAVVFNLLARAEAWIQTHTWRNAILKWNTAEWGEIPADFGRK